jgi:hypothetical protein
VIVAVAYLLDLIFATETLPVAMWVEVINDEQLSL